MPFTDDQIRDAVIKLFKKYDKDQSGYIEGTEIEAVLRDLTNELISKKQMTLP
jgi:Ca2+-binding EF-hand superfamily protein